MSKSILSESSLEFLALGWFSDLGYEVKFGPDIAPAEVDSAGAEGEKFGEDSGGSGCLR